MIKKTLYFGNPAYLKLRQQQMVVVFPDHDKAERSIPVEDIGLLVLDHSQLTMSHGLANALIDNNAAMLWCDDRHLPNGMVMPISANHTYTEKLSAQLASSEPLKKQLWKQTVQQKIRNQACVLEELNIEAGNMRVWAEQVKSGDTDNLEARAAVYYWEHVFKDWINGFRRERGGTPPNNMLNYGYAILRAIVARALVSSGCLPALGIHHRNKYNAFCLADDIMEPYRPYVDLVVLSLMDDYDRPPMDLDQHIKKQLLQIPVLDVLLEQQSSPLMVGVHRTTASLMRCFEGETRKLQYPAL